MAGTHENVTVSKPQQAKPLALLLVDDDSEFCSMMQEFFSNTGHTLDLAHNGRDGLAQVAARLYDLVILDVMMPVIDGMTVLQQIRKKTDLPVIMLTARVEQKDRIQGLNAGADDYVAKPFDADELLARIYAVLRRTLRSQQRNDTITSVGSLQLNSATREVRLSGQPVDLTSIEFDILEMLARSVGRVVSRDEITMLIFGRESTPYDRFLDVHISHLRKKLHCGQNLIRAIRGSGYIFTGQV
jgi:two-component system response regulator CpxR